ncbi:MAG: hypothetical protein LUE90_06220 [Clostridiales bacterium]|nr:hypothetical protein [Clostridiales bacterium]
MRSRMMGGIASAGGVTGMFTSLIRFDVSLRNIVLFVAFALITAAGVAAAAPAGEKRPVPDFLKDYVRKEGTHEK